MAVRLFTKSDRRDALEHDHEQHGSGQAQEAERDGVDAHDLERFEPAASYGQDLERFNGHAHGDESGDNT